MAKIVSQETFDAVVRENMEEFDMTPQEAIREAEEQFNAQGVLLANIIKDMILFTPDASKDDSASGSHPIALAVGTIQGEIDRVEKEKGSLNTATLTPALTQLRTQCQIDLAHRVMAGKMKAMSALYGCFCVALDSRQSITDFLSKDGDSISLIETLLDDMSTLINGQPDIVSCEQLNKFVDLIKETPTKTLYISELTALLSTLRYCALMHEANRQHMVERGIISPLVSLLEDVQHTTGDAPSADISCAETLHGLLVRRVCVLMRSLTLDDDMRVPFGKSHEHARLIVAETPALDLLIKLGRLYRHKDDHGVMSEIFHTLSCLSVRNEFCQTIMDLGGVEFILDALDNYMEYQNIVVTSLGLIKSLAGNDNVKVAVGKCGGLSVMLRSIDRHQLSDPVAFNGFSALATVCLKQPANSRTVATSGGIALIPQVMNIHAKNAGVLRSVCLLIRNMAGHCPDLQAPLLSGGLEALLNSLAMPMCEDEAKAALRDLGCKVYLRELWTGEKGHIPFD